MKFTRMGSTGTQVSRLCLGCMSFGGMADWMLDEHGCYGMDVVAEPRLDIAALLGRQETIDRFRHTLGLLK